MTSSVTTRDFKQTVLEADRPVLVDFHAEWCGPCRAQGPVVDQVADERGDAAVVVKVDVDAEPPLAELFQVRSIPTLLVFKDGKIANRFTGLTPKTTLLVALAETPAAHA